MSILHWLGPSWILCGNYILALVKVKLGGLFNILIDSLMCRITTFPSFTIWLFYVCKKSFLGYSKLPDLVWFHLESLPQYFIHSREIGLVTFPCCQGCESHQCPGRFSARIGQRPIVSKSNRWSFGFSYSPLMSYTAIIWSWTLRFDTTSDGLWIDSTTPLVNVQVCYVLSCG